MRNYRFAILGFLALALLCHSPAPAFAAKIIRIESDPPGARIVVNDKTEMGITPYDWKVDDWVTNPRKSTAFSKHLGEALTLSFTKDGCVMKTVVITTDPIPWRSLNGQIGYIYYVIKPEIVKAGKISVKLETIGQFLGGNPYKAKESVPAANRPAVLDTTMTIEDVVQSTLPAVVTITSDLGTGSGFLITDTGVIATNKHVIGNSPQVRILTSKGEPLVSDSILFAPD
jgi:hypothetical protein